MPFECFCSNGFLLNNLIGLMKKYWTIPSPIFPLLVKIQQMTFVAPYAHESHINAC